MCTESDTCFSVTVIRGSSEEIRLESLGYLEVIEQVSLAILSGFAVMVWMEGANE